MSQLAEKQKQEIVSSSPITPMQMLSMAVEQGADLDKLSKLMDLQERWEANEARKAFVVALNAFKADPPTITKNKHVFYKNKTGGTTDYNHASLDHASEEIGKALSIHGISHRWNVEQLDGGAIRVTCVLTHEKGHCESVPMQSGADQSGGKNSIQAIGSTVTYLQRYTLLAATGMAVKDQDDDAATAEPVARITQDQSLTLRAKLEETGASVGGFVEAVKIKFCCGDITKIEEIPASNYDACISVIENNAKRKQSEGAQE